MVDIKILEAANGFYLDIFDTGDPLTKPEVHETYLQVLGGVQSWVNRQIALEKARLVY